MSKNIRRRHSIFWSPWEPFSWSWPHSKSLNKVVRERCAGCGRCLFSEPYPSSSTSCICISLDGRLHERAKPPRFGTGDQVGGRGPLLRRRDCAKQADIRRGHRSAINTRRLDGYKESSVKPRMARRKRAVAGILVEIHDLEFAPFQARVSPFPDIVDKPRILDDHVRNRPDRPCGCSYRFESIGTNGRNAPCQSLIV